MNSITSKMDVISSSTTLPSDLNSVDPINETLDTTNGNSLKSNSLSGNELSQETVYSNSTETENSVNSIENSTKDRITVKDVQENKIDSENVNEFDKDNLEFGKDSTDCATNSVSDSNNICELSHSEDEKNIPEKDLSDEIISGKDLTEDLPAKDLTEDLPAKDLTEDLPAKDLSEENVSEKSAPEENIPSNDLGGKNVSEENLMDIVSEDDLLKDNDTEFNIPKEGETDNDIPNEEQENELLKDDEPEATVNTPEEKVETVAENKEQPETNTEDEKPEENQEKETKSSSEEQPENESSKEAETKISSPHPPESLEKSPDTEPSSQQESEVKEKNQDEEMECESATTKEKDVEEISGTTKEKDVEEIVEKDPVKVDEGNQTTDILSEADDQAMDQDQQENPVFVHVSTKDGENEGDKSLSSDSQNETGEDIMEVTMLVEEDPIGINQEAEKDDLMDFSEENSVKVVDFSDKSTMDDLVASKGADEELCIIPDTEREISQEEKDAATAAAAAKEDAATTTETPAVRVEESTEKTTNSLENAAPIPVEDEIIVNNASTTTDKSEIKVINIPEEDANEEACHQCCMVKKCIYKVDREKSTFICSETCLVSFKTLNKPPLDSMNPPLESLKIKDMAKKIPGSDTSKVFVRKCAECLEKIIYSDEKVLSWETMDFCNEDCLSRYQNRIGSHCANCKKQVLMSSLGKYCVRFGHDIRQFCCSLCLEEFKKGLKVCSYCQKDISGGTEGFLAPVGDKGQFKDFCTPLCMEKFDQMSNKNSNSKYSTMPVDIAQCSVCNNEKQVQVHFDQQNKEENKRHKFCSTPCFVAFKFVNQTDPLQCDMCKNYFENQSCTEYSIYYENVVKNFCCKTCQNIYIIANRRIVPCSWCKVKKYNFDMIKRACNNGQVLMMCSLNCLSLFQVSVNAVSSKRMKCDYCNKVSQAQYHLTMSDATIRNFCTYHCVMSFQGQFSKMPITLTPGEKTGPKPVPASGPKKYTFRGAQRVASNEPASVNEVRMPVITNVESLANSGTAASRGSNAIKINNQQASPQPEAIPKPQIKQQIIVKAPPLPAMKNAATSCKPILHTKGVSCRPHPCTKETQTDTIKEKTVIVPVPVPIYVPAPLPMYSAPVPVPIPFPLPIPVPIFIPTTRNSANGILKEIKKIQVKIPTDPFEAELLMMAEMVAGEKKVENTDSESEEDDTGDAGADGGFSPEAVDTSNTFGDDMLQMALKIANELEEPAVDLEGALTANTITASQNQDAVPGTEEAVDDPQPMHQLIDRQNMPIRGRKRTNRQPRNMNNPAKRGRRMSSHVEMPMMPPPQPSQPPEPVEKPDANMCLKYTFGVNAWKQWVTTKNAELEKSSRRVKLFKNEILQLTADELNYSLCLFVKEVRKPNGSEYAPDTIYYLCLGIQQYLFENGRIDNIFTDAYYEKFTDCLDEVARKFSVLYNDSHYIVTRVEEEHLWESKQLGAHSPHVLLSTLMFFNTKHFNLTTVDEHMQLSFSHIMKHWKRNPNQPGAAKIPGSRNVLLRFYPPQTTLDSNSRKKKVYEQQENEENPLRCPVKLYEFYLSKCPESVKTRNDVFYLLPERSCVPDSPVWYSTMALGREALEKMLHRVKMVKEINVALLTMD